MSTSAARRSARPWRRWSIIGVLVAVVIAVTVGLVLFFGGDEPEQVDAERALQQDQEAEQPEEGAAPEEPEPADEGQPGSQGGDAVGRNVGERSDEPTDVGPPEEPEDLDGRWVIDTSRDFDREEGRGTFGGYRIQEELAGIGDSVAVGRSPAVSGWVVFDAATVISAYVDVDLTELVSDDPRRDARVQDELGPTANATFELDDEIELPEVPPVGEVIQLTVPGTLTIRDVTNEVEVELQAAVTETGLIVAGSTQIVLADYDVEVPSATILLSVEDEATLEWQLFLVPA